MGAREIILEALLAHVGDGRQAVKIIDAFCDDTAKALTAAGYRILAPGELDRETLERAAEVAETHRHPRGPDNEDMRWQAGTSSAAAAIRALAGKAGEA